MSENVPCGLIDLNACFPVGGTVWEGLGGIALLDDVCHWVQTLRFQKPKPFPFKSLSAWWLLSQDVNSQLLLQCRACLRAAVVSAMIINSNPLKL